MEQTLSWLQNGLKFQCTGCGKCCTGKEGYVFLNEEDVERLSSFLGLSFDAFTRRFCRFVSGKLALLDRPGTEGDCVFLEGTRCSAYNARPVQCKTFPWWIDHIETRESWEEAGKSCEGINHPEAPLVPAEEIETACLTYLDSLLTQNFSL